VGIPGLSAARIRRAGIIWYLLGALMKRVSADQLR